MPKKSVIIRQLGLQPYLEVYEAMHDFTLARVESTVDEIWLVEHLPTFTQGKTGKPEHLLQQSDIPVIHTDRGGQITYHGPGQQIMYVMIDLKRAHIGIRELVTCLENSVIQTLAAFNIIANAKTDAPGVYVNEKKISSLGLHIKQGRTLHGLALNIDMDLTPFTYINPCGYQGLEMTNISDFVSSIDHNFIRNELVKHFIQQLHYDDIQYI